jgi:hypothetical protein
MISSIKRRLFCEVPFFTNDFTTLYDVRKQEYKLKKYVTQKRKEKKEREKKSKLV